jgi:ACS family hexuronate transporter-like MFS transporter
MAGSVAVESLEGRIRGMQLPYRQARWLITGWLTVSTILNLIDRQTLSILAPFLREKFHISQHGYSNIVSAFLVSYTVMYTVGGRLVDRIGERIGMAACIVWWSVCTMLTGFVQSAMSLGAVRFLLGIGEPGNYPAALRACARWFPKAERGLPIAMFSSGSSVGNVLAPPLIALLTLHFGWRAAFILPGSLGLLWTVVWLWMYRVPAQYPSISREELAALQEERSQVPSPESQVVSPGDAAGRDFGDRWSDLLGNRNVLALVLARFVSDPVWYFYLFYIPDYLKAERGFSLRDIGLFAWMPFVAGTAGGMLAGLISDLLIRRGWKPVAARTRVLYVTGAMAPLGMLTSRAPSAALAIVLMAVVAFCVYCWFINTAAVIPDLFPEKVVGSVLGLMGTAGSAGGVLFTQLVGFLLTHYSYGAAFALAGSMHLLAAVILWSLLQQAPRARASCSLTPGA